VSLDDEAVSLLLEQGTTLVPTLLAVRRIVARRDSVTAWMAEKAIAAQALHERGIGLAVERGVRIAAGTDAGTPFNPHGSLADEVQALTDVGLTPGRRWRRPRSAGRGTWASPTSPARLSRARRRTSCSSTATRPWTWPCSGRRAR
jgi:hypothetical protein